MWDLKACRSCLSTKDKLERATEIIRRTYAALTGLEFNVGDGYPTYFCVFCHSQLKKCLAFRRKSRRAYYVLHRFMTSKKQITLNDIMTVNRRRNNLVSTIGNSKLSSVACYKFSEVEKPTSESNDNDVNENISNIPSKTLTAQEFYSEFLSNDKSAKSVGKETTNSNQQEVTQRKELEKYEPSRNGFVFQMVVIKSAEQLEEERLELERVLEDDTETVSNDVDFGEDPSQPPPPEIDLEDVFKDLVEDNKDSDESEPEQVIEKPKTKKELREEKQKEKIALQKKKEKENRVNRISKSLPFCEMIPQSLKEQQDNWAKRMCSEPYKSARVKCCICLLIFDKFESLMEHVTFHNKMSINSDHVACNICKGRFASAEEHEKHFFEVHLYTYECKLCSEVLYDLNDYSAHYYKAHFSPNSLAKPRIPTYSDLAAMYYIDQLPLEEMKTNVARLSPSTNKCKQCHINFSNAYTLVRHMRTHNMEQLPNGGAVCDYCSAWFQSKPSLINHMERWHLYSYRCRMCEEVIYCREDALRHRSKHTFKGKPDGAAECQYCNSKMSTRSIDFHIFRHHYTQKYHLHCVTCGKSSSNQLSFYKHQLQEHGKIILPTLKIGDPDYVCKHCDVQLLNQDAYYTHLLKHRHPEASDIPNSCTLCRVRFNTPEEHNFHVRTCKNRSYPRDCVYCSMVLTSTAHSVKHYMTVHKELSYHRLGPTSKCVRYLLCEICGISVKSSRIAMHTRVHQEGLLQCALCEGIQFTTARQVVLHVLKCHCDKPFICMICQNKFKQRSQCRDHILKTHAPVRPFKCPSCPLKFSHRDYLNEHNFKIHEVPIPRRGPSKKLKGVCTTYPHMQVDISLVPENVINDVQFRICDYHDKNLTNLRDHTRFFLTTRHDAAQPTPLTQVHVESIKRKFKEEVEGIKIKKFKKAEFITSDAEFITSGHELISSDHEVITSGHELITSGHEVITSGHEVITSGHEVIKSGHDVFSSENEVITSDTEVIASDMVVNSLESIEDVKVESVPDYQDFGTTEVEEVFMEGDEIKLDEEDTYEVVEAENGERFVVINNVMYKIEEEEEPC